jgi:aminomethyltransferase
MTELRATPFHARAAEASRCNEWETRNGFTLASAYDDAPGEAIAARFGAAMADISWHSRIELIGPQAPAFVSRLFTRDVSALAPGAAMRTLWLDDDGAVRGLGTVARFGRESFVVLSPADDRAWFAQAADLFGVEVRDQTGREGILALTGPSARNVLAAAGLETGVSEMGLRRLFWRGLDVMLSRLGTGYELWCNSDDAGIVWDRLAAAGRSRALRPAGQTAMDILDIECGTLRAGRDFVPSAGAPQALGLSVLVESEHAFNGRAGVRAAGPPARLFGLVFDGDAAVPARTALTHDGRPVGRVLASLHSPAMRGTVGLGVLPADHAAGTALAAGETACRSAALPILPIPGPIPTDMPPMTV